MKKVLLLLLLMTLAMFAMTSCGGDDPDGDENNDPCKDGHAFSDYVSDDNATCTTDSTKTAVCERCGETDTVIERGTAKGHSFGEYASDGNATCVSDGTKTAECEREGCTAKDTVDDDGSATGIHIYGEYISDGNATCMSDGTKTAECTGCDETDTVADEGSRKNHVFLDYVLNNNATCTEDGTETAACETEGCNETHTRVVAGSAKGHDMSGDPTVTKNPTCTEKGEQKLQCKECSHFTTSEIPALGHDYSIENGYKGADGHADKCSCGAVDTENITPHTPDRDAPTETDAVLCTECGYVIEAKLDHTHDFSVKTVNGDTLKKAATCTAAAEYWYTCSCDAISDTLFFENGETKPHDYSDATCGAPKTCKDCQATDGDPVGEHNYKDATCFAPKTCTVCGATDGVKLEHVWKDATCTEAKACNLCGTTEGSPLPHNYEDATCTAPKTCKGCGATEGSALGHAWCDATCTAPKHCETCGVNEGNPLPHSWTDANCTTPKTCTACGATEGEKLGHSFGKWEVIKEATTTEKGKRRRECEHCDHYEEKDIPRLDDGNPDNDGPGDNMDSGGWTPL